MEITPLLENAAFGLELVGVAIILIGVLFGLARLARGVLARTPGTYDDTRAAIARSILLGLELLVGADIVQTVTAPLTLESVGLLAGVVLIRTFLSVAISAEIEGRSPWRSRE